VRHWFSLADQRFLCELNDLARRSDSQPADAELCEGLVPAKSASGLTPDDRRVLRAIDELPPDEGDVFDSAWIEGISHAEVSQVLGVSSVTVKLLSRTLRHPAEQSAGI
jgi:DNA-directed RNA polymerase specialized sigma24 family protein